MPTNVIVTSTSALTTAIPTPDDTEGATGPGLDGMVQPLLNNDAFLNNVVNVQGVKIVRSVTSLANLKALTGLAHREIVLMDDATLGFHLFVYHSSATTTPDDVLCVQPTSMGGRFFSAVLSALGVNSGIAVYNSSGKLELGKVKNHIIEINDAVLGAPANVTSTSYTTVLNKVLSASLNVGDIVSIDVSATMTATLAAGACSHRLTVSENAGADIAISGTEDLFDSSVKTIRTLNMKRTVATGGSFEVRWQIKSGSAGNAATLAQPSSLRVQVIRP